ncbi:MAG: glycogen debranching enzyme N-terminal domain-containing protein [Candidatus Hydrogenedentes bacterium]|nr:glycogen debranching enzyme N-terminal domain-containing protein [Candidatus Hydrogenedentota bacterium]
MAVRLNTHDEWLEPDGLGGFASGTVSAIRTRRYHALLLTARTPPTGRVVLINGFDAWITTPRGNYPLTSQVYEPGVVSPNGWERIESFTSEPWPKWRYTVADGLQIEHELFVPHGSSAVVLTWRAIGDAAECSLSVRPFFSGRDYHSMHAESAAFHFDPTLNGGKVSWRPYADLPGIHALSNGEYIHEPQWYRNFIYEEERARGLNYVEDLASPGAFRWNLAEGPAALIFAAQGYEHVLGAPHAPAESIAEGLRHAESNRRAKFAHPLHRAADAYIVKRGEGNTIVAGYPWFTDWGRDTFIALRGLCLSTGRIEEAHNILIEWAGAVSEGMLPNFFTDSGAAPEYNTVDAPLWYVIAVHDYLQRTTGKNTAAVDAATLREAIDAIVTGYAKGTRYRIQMDADGLLAAGEPGVQLTWMDAKVGDWVVTPRIGKPVEIQALWINALRIASQFADKWDAVYKHALASFESRFWNESHGFLYDVIDCDHRDGAMDESFRPNQVFAVGGLPFRLIEGERAWRIVDAIEAKLWTPIGLRTLDRDDADYRGRYEGGVGDRDGAYHQGTVWPWLMGAFVDAWVGVRGGTDMAKQEARTKFLAPLLSHLNAAGLGHICEIADAEPPHMPRGCPFQAWSVGEALRIHHDILGA